MLPLSVVIPLHGSGESSSPHSWLKEPTDQNKTWQLLNVKGATDHLQWKLNAYINLDLIHANYFKIHDIWQERNPSLSSGQMSKPKKLQTKLLTCKHFQQYLALIEDACVLG